MRGFLVDEDLPRSLAAALTAAGLEAVHVVDAGLRGQSDTQVLAEAIRFIDNCRPRPAGSRWR